MGEFSEFANKIVKSISDINDSENMKRAYSPQEVASIIDHTILSADAAKKDIIRLCREADKFSFASAVAQPSWIRTIRDNLQNPDVKVCGISGFPLGGHTSAVKAFEAAKCVEDGADEVDMVINVGWAKQGEWKLVEDEIAGVVKAVSDLTVVKVIIECCLLTDEEKVKACLCIVNAGANFVKSSTGFSKWGAKASDVALMRRVVGDDFGVKASGGIRIAESVYEMIAAGANRIGTSSGVQIMEQILSNAG